VTKVLFETNLRVVFAFQAGRLQYTNGRYKSLHPERDELKLMTNDNETIKETGYLCDQLGTGFAPFRRA